jgi:ribosome-associated protein
VDFVVHVFLSERRAFYDIERLRKSARPLTPAEFDAELKTALKEKTRAVRTRAPIKARAASAKSASRPATRAKKPAKRAKTAKKPAKKAAPRRKAAAAKKKSARPSAKKTRRSR